VRLVAPLCLVLPLLILALTSPPSRAGCGSQVLNDGAFVGNGNGISGEPPVRQGGINGPFCDMACAGNSNELCGGPNRLNLYNYTGSTTATVLPSVGGWLSLGCFRYAILLRLGFPTRHSCTPAETLLQNDLSETRSSLTSASP
jgi:hypothetical protein